jgi:hypothetical protein
MWHLGQKSKRKASFRSAISINDEGHPINMLFSIVTGGKNNYVRSSNF